jgi:hypothetical protein
MEGVLAMSEGAGGSSYSVVHRMITRCSYFSVALWASSLLDGYIATVFKYLSELERTRYSFGYPSYMLEMN